MTDPGPDALFVELQSVLLGRYSLEREVGRGGMGIVYLARDVALDRPVAIKPLPPALAERPALRERFLREARTAARLSHPNIVPIHTVGEAGRLGWFVMAFAPGESLGQRLRSGGPLAPGEASRVLRDVAWALGYAHSQGVVHRDVKPDNILLEAGTRRALIADFGIAAPALHQADPDGVVGTVAYLSPEQGRGDVVDGGSDIYALGVVGWCALSSRLPYSAPTLGELVAQHLGGAAPPFATVAPHVPRALCRVIDRCLAQAPAGRFPAAEQLAEALDQLSTAPPELPAALRVWLTKGTQARQAVTLWTVLWGPPGLLGTLGSMASGYPGWLVVGAFMGSIALAPWPLHLAARVGQTRKVLGAGYSANDLVLAIRSQVDTCDDRLLAVEALLEVKRQVAPYIDLQLVAFPQDGLYRTKTGRENVVRALDMGVDVVGGIPHFERTMADGTRSVTELCEIAAERGLMVDMHCDETDDPNSRHIEQLAYETRRLGLQGRVNGSHLTSMHSMDNYYVSKLLPLIAEAGVSAIPNPLINIMLQGRHDTFPKRRGLTRVKEMQALGIRVGWGQDCVLDPWYSLGTADMLDVAFMGLHVAQMSSPADMAKCFDMVTSVNASIMGLDHLGLEVGKRASLVVLDAGNPIEAVRLRPDRLCVISRGKVVARRPRRDTQLSLPGRPATVARRHLMPGQQ